MGWHRRRFIFSYMTACRNHIISNDAEKFRNSSYELCVHSRLHADAQVLTSHIGKIVKLWYFGCDSVANSEAQITYRMFFIVSLLIVSEPIREMRRSENWVAKNEHVKILSVWYHFFGSTSTPLCPFLSLFSWTHLSPFKVMYFLNGPLEAHSQPCQTSKMELLNENHYRLSAVRQNWKN